VNARQRLAAAAAAIGGGVALIVAGFAVIFIAIGLYGPWLPAAAGALLRWLR